MYSSQHALPIDLEALSPLNVLMLSDGIPGHYNQSLGLVDKLKSRYQCNLAVLNVKLRAKFITRHILPRLIHHQFSHKLISLFYHIDSQIPSPDLILSTGGNTAFINASLAKNLNIPNIFIGSRRRMYSHDFSAHLTITPTNQANNIVMQVPPSQNNPTELATEGRKLREALGYSQDKKLFLLALGGNGVGYEYDDESCKQIAELINTLSMQHNCQWLLTTSRRTGKELEHRLKHYLKHELLIDCVWWHESPRKVMKAYLGAADQIFVSIDSMSMISESIGTGKPTTLLEPNISNPDLRYQKSIEKFLSLGLCSKHNLNSVRGIPKLKTTNDIALASDAFMDDLMASISLKKAVMPLL
jgi:hypothetical protein